MSYSRENLLSVSREFADKRQRAQNTSEARKTELYLLHPELLKLDRELAKTAMKVFDEISKGSENIDERVALVRKENEDLQRKRALLLISYGYPADYTTVKYECSDCKDTGYIEYKMCPCFRRALTIAGYKSSGIGNLLRTQSFDNFSLDYYQGDAKTVMSKVVAYCKNYAEKFDGKTDTNILMYGSTGLGKTHLTTSIAARVIERGFDVVYDNAQSMFREFEKERFGKNSDAYIYTDKYFDCELLIIDDLGTEMANQFTVGTLYSIINSRVIKGRATIVNTNCTPDEVRKRYGDRTLSRLFGEYMVLTFCGKDIRMQKLGSI